jgi:hypothetical protein
MRFLSCVLLSMTFFACTPQAPGAGTAHHPCRTGFTLAGACNEGLRCVDDTCVPCGTDGELCCQIAGGSQNICNSNSGVACDDMIDQIGTCTTTCGSPGLACCDYDTCPNGGDCEGGMCTGTPQPPTGGNCTTFEDGDTKYHLNIISGDCGYAQVIFYAATLAEAEDCRAEYVNLAASYEEVCDLEQIPEFNKFCDNNTNFPPAISHDFYYCSDTQLQSCQAYWCADCSWSAGVCP